MDENDMRLVQCHGKVGHRTREDAAAALKRAEIRKRDAPGTKLQIYRCPHCGLWHYGKGRDETLKKRAKEKKRQLREQRE